MNILSTELPQYKIKSVVPNRNFLDDEILKPSQLIRDFLIGRENAIMSHLRDIAQKRVHVLEVEALSRAVATDCQASSTVWYENARYRIEIPIGDVVRLV